MTSNLKEKSNNMNGANTEEIFVQNRTGLTQQMSNIYFHQSIHRLTVTKNIIEHPSEASIGNSLIECLGRSLCTAKQVSKIEK